MKKNVIYFVGGIIVVLVGFGVWYFAIRTVYTPIGKLLENPSKYENKMITIKGEVVNRMSLLAVKYYILRDKTGEIKVITKHALPAIGVKVAAKGKIKTAYAIGSLQEIVFIEQ